MPALRLLATFATLLCAAIFVVHSLHWPLLGDASLMHYVVFLMDHGFIPYRDIHDPNLPGTYAVQWLVVHTLGPGDLAWRMYDVLLAAIAAAAMCLIAGPAYRLAGLFAGSLFLLLHGRDGIAELGQRDLLMTVLLLLSTASLTCGLRTRRLLLVAVAGLLSGMAVTVKPTAALSFLAMLVFLAISAGNSPWPRRRLLAAGLISLFLAPLVAAAALYRVHALRAFAGTLTGLDRYHNSLFQVPVTYFLTHPIPSSLLALTLAWLAALLRQRPRFTREQTLLLLGFLAGELSFLLQRKAYSYHRYPADAFLLLLISLAFFRATEHPSRNRFLKAAGVFGLAWGALVLAPQCLLHTRHLSASPQDFSHLLERDRTALAAHPPVAFSLATSVDGRRDQPVLDHVLDHHVQCLDFTAGCVTTLARMHLVQSTGFLYDCYGYGAPAAPVLRQVVRQYREAFLAALDRNPPAVLVLSSQNCGGPDSFAKVDRWPALGELVAARYVLFKEVTPPDPIHWANQPAQPYSYRLYLHR